MPRLINERSVIVTDAVVVSIFHEGAAITAACGVTPCHQGSLLEDCSKGAVGTLQLLHVLQLLLHFAAVASEVRMTPRHHGATFADGCEGNLCRLDVLDSLQLVLDAVAVSTVCRMTPSDHTALVLLTLRYHNREDLQ